MSNPSNIQITNIEGCRIFELVFRFWARIIVVAPVSSLLIHRVR